MAGEFCKNLTAGAFHDWTLPTIDQIDGGVVLDVPAIG